MLFTLRREKKVHWQVLWETKIGSVMALLWKPHFGTFIFKCMHPIYWAYYIISVVFEASCDLNYSPSFSFSTDKQLKQYLGFLSKCMTGNLVQKMSNYLYRSRTITAYESQVITSQATDMQKSSKMMQIVIKKGQSACGSFLRCLGICDPGLYEKVTGYPGWTIYQISWNRSMPMSEFIIHSFVFLSFLVIQHNLVLRTINI